MNVNESTTANTFVLTLLVLMLVSVTLDTI